MFKKVAMSGLASVAFFCAEVQGAEETGLQTVPHVDIQRYMGTWYEIARLRIPWERQCAHNTIAVYTMEDDGNIHVLNQCQTGKSPHDVQKAEGKAQIVDKTSNAKLKVTLAPLERFKWAFNGDYWIIQLADDYSYAVVSEPTQNHLCILSRTPDLSEDIYQGILNKVALQLPNINILNVLPTQQDPLKTR